MPYLGNNPTANFASVTKDTFSGNGSATAFTLSKVATTNGAAVYVENVRQIPTTAYAISGTTLTFTAAPVSGTNNIYVMHHNTPVSTTTHPSAQDLTATSGTFTGDVSIDGGSFVFNESSADKDFRVESNGNANMLFVDGGNDGVGIGTSSVDTASTLTVSNTSDAHGITIVGALNKSRMQFQGANTGSASTDGLIIGLSSSDDTNDDSALIGLKENGSMSFQTNNTNHLIIDGNGHVTMPLQPAFSVTANQQNDLTINANNTIQFANEIFDQNADFNTSNYTFTAPVTGKYMLNVNVRMDNVNYQHTYMYMTLSTSNRVYEAIVDLDRANSNNNDWDYLFLPINVLADMDASDTAYVIMTIPNAGSSSSDIVGSQKCTFSGYLAC